MDRYTYYELGELVVLNKKSGHNKEVAIVDGVFIDREVVTYRVEGRNFIINVEASGIDDGETDKYNRQ